MKKVLHRFSPTTAEHVFPRKSKNQTKTQSEICNFQLFQRTMPADSDISRSKGKA